MTLGDLIVALEGMEPERVVAHGFKFAHSYRGIYAELAFEPAENVAVKDMLREAKSAVGRSFEGYKGGEFTMGEYTDVWLANYGDTGEPFTSANLKLWELEPQADLEQALKLLEKHEWVADDDDFRWCVECEMTPAEGHQPDCTWAGLLKKYGREVRYAEAIHD